MDAKRLSRRGQAMVEFAILLPFLLALSLGTVDFGRIFGQGSAISGAAREAARQAIYFDPTTQTNPHFSSSSDTDILGFAQDELGSSTSLTFPPGSGNPQDLSTCLNPAGPLDQTLYPTKADTGYLYICRSGTGSDGENHIQVSIFWTMSTMTPFVQTLVGTPHVHSIVDATEQSAT